MKLFGGKLLRFAERGAELIGAALFAVIFGLFIVQIVLRYVFSSPLGWPDEVISCLFVWVVFWAAALTVPLREHIAFDLLHEALPRRLRRATELLGLVALALLFLLALPVVIDFIHFSRRQTSAVLGIPLSWVYAPVALLYVAIPLRAFLGVVRIVREHQLPQKSDSA